MNLLAIDTATERCSVAVRIAGTWFERTLDTQRGHADIVLSMIDSVLTESGTRLEDLSGIAYGRGPGAFTGVRIAVGVVQGLAFGAQLPTVGVSNLAAVAQQVASEGSPILVCMDARMNEVYWGVYAAGVSAPLEMLGPERLDAPGAVDPNSHLVNVVAGTGISAYSEIAMRFAHARQIVTLPRARDILLLAEHEFEQGRGQSAFDVQPVYLRDRVAFVKSG